MNVHFFTRGDCWRQLVFMGMVGFLPMVLAEEPKDYSKGFDKFSQLGIPDVKDAAYMQLSGGDLSSQYGDRFGAPAMTGNAWLLQKKEDGKHVFLKDSQVTEVYDQAVAQKEMQEKIEKAGKAGKKPSRRELMALYQGVGVKKGGSWKDADLEKDIKSLIEFLQKPGGIDENVKSQMEYNGGWGSQFLFAFNIYRKGHAKEANQILGLLFQLSGDSRKVVQQALNQVAGAQQSQAYETFIQSHDWKQYAASLEALLARAPSWSQAPAVMRLLEAIKKRVAMKDPPPVVGEGLTEEDQKLARELVTSAKDENVSLDEYRGYWIVKGGGGDMQDGSALGRIVARGVKSFPLLMALLKDETLTPVTTLSSWSGRTRYYDVNDGMQTEEEILAAYEAMARPASRADIARTLIGAIVLDERQMNNGEGAVADDLLKKSKAWYALNANKTTLEILRACLSDASPSRKYVAINSLTASGKEEDAVFLEKYFLESKDPGADLNLINGYIVKRGSKAKEFLDKYLALLKSKPSSTENIRMDEESRKRMDEQREKTIAMLKEMVSGKNAEAVIAEMLAQTKKWDYKTCNESGAVLSTKLAAEKPSKALTLLLDAALKAQDGLLATQLLGIASRVNMLKSQGAVYDPETGEEIGVAEDPAASSEAPPDAALKVEAHAGQWKKLLAIQSPLDQGQGASAEDTWTVGQYSGFIMEGLYGGVQQDMQMWSVLGQLGKRGWDVFRLRGEARLDGKSEDQLPPFPSAAHVTAEQRAALKAKLSGLNGEALVKAMPALSMDEQLALGEILAGDEALNGKLVPLASVIRNVRVETDDAALKQLCEGFKGKSFDRKMIEDLVEHSKRLVKEGKPAMLMVSRTGDLQGYDIKSFKGDQIAEMYFSGYGNKQSMLTVTALGRGGGTTVSSNATWMVDSAAAAKPAQVKTNEVAKASSPLKDDLLETTVEEQDYSSGAYAQMFVQQQKNFWEKVDTLCSPKYNACGSSAITLMGIIPKPKK